MVICRRTNVVKNFTARTRIGGEGREVTAVTVVGTLGGSHGTLVHLHHFSRQLSVAQ